MKTEVFRPWEVVLSFLLGVFCGYLPVLGQHSPTPPSFQVSNPSSIPYFNISSDLSEKEGLDLLLRHTRYDNRSIPPLNGKTPPSISQQNTNFYLFLAALQVSVSVLLLTLASPDESSLVRRKSRESESWLSNSLLICIEIWGRVSYEHGLARSPIAIHDYQWNYSNSHGWSKRALQLRLNAHASQSSETWIFGCTSPSRARLVEYFNDKTHYDHFRL